MSWYEVAAKATAARFAGSVERQLSRMRCRIRAFVAPPALRPDGIRAIRCTSLARQSRQACVFRRSRCRSWLSAEVVMSKLHCAIETLPVKCCSLIGYQQGSVRRSMLCEQCSTHLPSVNVVTVGHESKLLRASGRNLMPINHLLTPSPIPTRTVAKTI